ncbi:Anaerobic glycerol-3-phosphate dehydrogenase subunit C [compost metagenome]
MELISRLGYKVYLAPYAPNGKPLQVQGFLKAFEKAASFNGQSLLNLQQYRIPLVGLDPAMTLVYRQEYPKTLQAGKAPLVMLAQEWLIDALPKSEAVKEDEPYHFLPHCTEKTNEPGSIGQWQSIFQRVGLTLQVQASGCCGMSGTYGHETRNARTSDTIYGQSWKRLIHTFNQSGRVVADGYSCRSQVKRQEGVTVLHPLQVLLARVKEATVESPLDVIL